MTTAAAALSVAAVPVVATGLSSTASAATVTSVTRYTVAVTNIRTGPATTYARVSTLPAGTAVTGTLTSSNWIHISAPASLAGRYISAGVLSTKAPAASKPTVSSAPNTSKVATVVGSSSATAAQTVTAPSQVGSLRAPIGTQVTRWVEGFAGTSSPATVRLTPSTHAAAVGSLTYGTAVVGSYVSQDWFLIATGVNTGRYVSAALLANTSDFAQIDGQIPSANLCALPSFMQNGLNPAVTRYLDCSAAASLVEMNTAFKAQFGYDMGVTEAYRDLATQKLYFAMWGWPRAAYPGTSNHGFGAAIDLGAPTGMTGNPFYFGSAADQWLTANGKSYGWDRPSFLDSTGYSPEYWHYNYIG